MSKLVSLLHRAGNVNAWRFYASLYHDITFLYHKNCIIADDMMWHTPNSYYLPSNVCKLSLSNIFSAGVLHVTAFSRS